MTVRTSHSIRRVVCDEPGCRAMVVTEDAEVWHIGGHGNGATHRCPEHQSALGMAEALEREQERRAG